VGIKDEVVVAGVLNKIELWPKEKYEEDLKAFLHGSEESADLQKMAEEAFALLDEENEEKAETEVLETLLNEV